MVLDFQGDVFSLFPSWIYFEWFEHENDDSIPWNRDDFSQLENQQVTFTLLETNIAPEKWWLEDHFYLGMGELLLLGRINRLKSSIETRPTKIGLKARPMAVTVTLRFRKTPEIDGKGWQRIAREKLLRNSWEDRVATQVLAFQISLSQITGGWGLERSCGQSADFQQANLRKIVLATTCLWCLPGEQWKNLVV